MPARRALAMNHCRAAMNWETPDTLIDAQIVACPRCRTALTFRRSAAPLIDACGFESYQLVCDQCGTTLGGVIDPADDKLLLSQIAA
jgi:uncharacterized protein YbaR (Trm112 family)